MICPMANGEKKGVKKETTKETRGVRWRIFASIFVLVLVSKPHRVFKKQIISEVPTGAFY